MLDKNRILSKLDELDSYLKELSARALLKRLIILTMELASAQNAGRMYTELEKQGEPIGLRDVMIGTIAVTKGYRLATRNIEHFQKIKGLNLIPIP